tara:strand:- start:460 stop:603 length:144 start_codon:yes stop_codon:yes gene_type:complete
LLARFLEQDIDGRSFLKLTPTDLMNIGILVRKQVNDIMDIIQKLKKV